MSADCCYRFAMGRSEVIACSWTGVSGSVCVRCIDRRRTTNTVAAVSEADNEKCCNRSSSIRATFNWVCATHTHKCAVYAQRPHAKPNHICVVVFVFAFHFISNKNSARLFSMRVYSCIVFYMDHQRNHVRFKATFSVAASNDSKWQHEPRSNRYLRVREWERTGGAGGERQRVEIFINKIWLHWTHTSIGSLEAARIIAEHI